MSTTNRKYKDSVFVDLFSEDEKAKENFEIAEKSAEQKYYDTAVSRLYYSSYQRIINYINCNDAKEDFENFKKSPSNNNKGSPTAFGLQRSQPLISVGKTVPESQLRGAVLSEKEQAF